MDDGRSWNCSFRNAKEIGDWHLLGISIMDQFTKERQNDQTKVPILLSIQNAFLDTKIINRTTFQSMKKMALRFESWAVRLGR